MIERLVTLLRRRDSTQEQFESMCGLSRNRISKWVMGQGEPKARELWRMARELNVPIEHFLDESATLTKDQPPPDPTPDRSPPDEDIALAYALVRKLGPERAICRLMLDDRDRAAHPINGSSPEPR
jgi:transcriptional regulator with XRE-family HTH domain